jgi:hypothetical protein
MADDTTTTRAAPLTADEYLESLSDGREVYVDGERVADVTRHRAFRNLGVTRPADIRGRGRRTVESIV